MLKEGVRKKPVNGFVENISSQLTDSNTYEIIKFLIKIAKEKEV